MNSTYTKPLFPGPRSIGCSLLALSSAHILMAASQYQADLLARIEQAPAVSGGVTVAVAGGGGSAGVYDANCFAGAPRIYFSVGLEPDATYNGTITRDPPTHYCGAFVGIPYGGNPPPACYQVVSEIPAYPDGTDPATIPFTLALRPQHRFIAWDFPKGGLQALTADGYSSVHGSVTAGAGTLTWQFGGQDLGCKLVGDSTGVVVTAGTNTGTVTIQATTSSNTCFSIPLDLVDCNSACVGGSCSGGGVSVGQGSLDIKIGMGWSLRGGSAGYLRIREAAPTNTIASPAGLHYDFRRADVKVFTNSLGLTQVKSAQQLANIVSNSVSSYSIRLFTLTNILYETPTGFELTGSPYRTITITNLNGDTNLVRVTDSGDNSDSDYTWQTNGWLLTTGGWLRNELKTTVYSASNTIATVTTTVFSGTNAPAYSKVETWQTFSTNGQRLISEVFGTGSAARTNTYSYTADGYPQQTLRWDGTWRYYLYDSSNRPTNVFSGFLNQGVTTNRSLCRLVELDYSTNVISGAGDNGNLYFLTPRRTAEYVQGVEVGRKYFLGLPGEQRTIQCTTPGAAWNAAANLVTTYKLFTNSMHLNEPWIITEADGTAEIFQYGPVGETTTNVVLTGHLDSSGTNVDAGSKTITVLSSTGNLLSETTTDIESSIITSQETHSYDILNRRTNTTFLDGTSLQTGYDCCAVASQKDREGTVTSYTHDALKRLLTTTVNGITVSNTYDPAGRILSVTRLGTNGAAITISQAAFNDAGDQTSSTDALGNTATYTNYIDSSSQLVSKTTRPDTGTIIETRYADSSPQGRTGTAAWPARYEYGAEDDGSGATNFYTKEIKLDANDGTNEWIKTYTDTAGRRYKTVFAAASGPYPSALSLFNSNGQLTNQLDPDGVSTIFAYSAKGEHAYTVLDSNRNYTIDFSGNDRISFTTNDVLSDSGSNVRRTRTFVWSTDGAGASNLVSSVESSVDGLRTWKTIWNNGVPVTSQTRTTYDPANGLRIVTDTAPDGSYTITTNKYGRTISVTAYDALTNQLSSVTYGYDPHGRQNTAADARNGTTTFYFNDADQISSTVTPAPAAGQSAQITTNFFDNMGRIVATKLPDNTFATNKYDLTGQLTNTFGSRTYPVAYTYDAQGRMKTMKTWTNFAANSGAATTTWNYDQYRGFLASKTYDGNTPGPSYTYTPAGRLQTRLWARGTNTTYYYNNAGDPSGITYSDGATPGTGYGYDRRGRQASITNGAGVSALTFNEAGNLLSESNTGGPLDGLSVTNGYDQFLRRTNLSVQQSNNPLIQQSFAFDAASRLKSVSDGTNSASYSYVANSPLVGQIAFTNSGAQRMVTTKQYDLLNRVTNISSVSSVQSVVNFGYQYNSANQRTRRTEADSSYWVYNYDSLGQVIGGRKYWSDGTPVAGQQFTYAFDDIGNRQTTASGGDQSGGNLHSATYTANNLNQYSSRTVPAFLNDLGTANSNATVTLWNSDGTFAQAYRHGEYFRNELAVTNGSSALWPTLTNLAVLSNGTNADIVTNTVGNAFVPKTPEPFAYDADGNLVSNGRWTNHWDAENRLVSMESLTNTPAASKRRLTFGYDHQGRRITKSVETWNGATWTIIVSNRFLFDGWNLIAELNATNNAVIRSYLWGLDVSGTIRGAGGVGGLMAVSDSVQGVHFVAFDGNGNAAALTRATDGTTSATYEYGAFGEVIRATGPTARVSPFRWSTKYQDDETDLLYYGRRSLNASTGRFLSKDPIEEQGGLNPYTFALNRPLDVLDILGLGNYKLGGPTEPPMAFDEDFVYDPNAKATAGDYLAWTKWGGMLLASDLLRHDLSDANAAYAHYRDGTGTDMDIDYEKAYRDDSNIHGGLNNEIASAEAEAERLAASGGPHFTMTGDAVRMGQPITEDWQKTIGGHWLWGSATVEQCAGKFTMTITLHEKDRYNFNRGASDIATGLPDNANGRFAVLGWAKSFITNGKVVKKVTWQKGQESSTTNIENLPRR